VKLNSISIGGGLALVAVGLLANAAASLVGSADKVAHADDLKTKRLQAVADAPMLRADEGGAEMVAMGDGGACVEGEPLNWFGAIRWFPACSGSYLSLARTPLIYADVNADGAAERFGWTRASIYGSPY
jgi:hypothetical protein